jgi:hypothetical protein
MQSGPKPSGVERLFAVYGLMIRACPRPFRERFGQEMLVTFRDQALEACRTSGRRGLWLLAARILSDWIVTLRREYCDMPNLVMRSSTLFLRTVILLIGISAVALLLWEPRLEGRNAHATNFEIYFNDPFLALVYAGSIPFFVALHQAFKLLGHAGQSTVFSPQAVKRLRTIKTCAMVIIGFVVAEEVFILLTHGDDDAAGGIFIGLVIIFGAVVVAATAAMFERILQNAVDIKSGPA